MSRKGKVVFRSDNLSVISVLREILSKETAQKKISVKITHGTATPTACSVGVLYPDSTPRAG